MKPYPAYRGNDSFLQAVATNRKDDITEMESLDSRFIAGRFRKKRAVPASSADVVGDDKLNDWVTTATDLYVVVNNAGTLEWRTVALATF